MNNTATDYILVADIGGTHCRFAVVDATDYSLGIQQQWRCADYDDLQAALTAFQQPLNGACLGLCLALPGPVHLQPVPLVNNPWRQIDLQSMRARLPFPIWALNDFSAQAWCLNALQDEDQEHWRPGGEPVRGGTQLIIGPGTGLGVGGLIDGRTVIECEAGQMQLAPATAKQRQLLQSLATQLPRVINESVASGPGLCRLHTTLHGEASASAAASSAAIITAARAGDKAAVETLTEFAGWFGSICGDLALGVGATNGVYLSGALLAAMADIFPRAAFLQAFDDKQGYQPFCAAIGVQRVCHPQPGLLGAAEYARYQLGTAATS